MTDFDKLMEILKVKDEDERNELFEGLVSKNFELVLFFHEDGSINWGTLG
jgi:hypothetical protein